MGVKGKEESFKNITLEHWMIEMGNTVRKSRLTDKVMNYCLNLNSINFMYGIQNFEITYGSKI